MNNEVDAADPILTVDWFPQQLPEGAKSLNVPMRTSDGAAVNGTLYQKGQPETVVCLMHPREFLGCHYLVPILVNGGAAVWVQGARSVGNDLRLEHEQAILDVAAGLCFLKEQQFKRIVLLGNSGGAGLFTYYLQQAELAPDERIDISPAGKPTKLRDAKMPLVDALIYLAPHPGQGRLLLKCIDPSVADENDPISVVSELDPFNPRNGYVDKPGQSRYSEDFVEKYRLAQRARVEHIDEIAKGLIKARLDARKARKAGDSTRQTQLRAAHTPIFTVWRTDADLRCLDNSLDPSDRNGGSLWSHNMMLSNYGAVGFGRLCTPESWLTTWSGVSANAALEKCAPSVSLPVLIVEFSGDQTTFPSDYADILSWLSSEDKTHVKVRGDHHGRALNKSEEPGRYLAGRKILHWLGEKGLL